MASTTRKHYSARANIMVVLGTAFYFLILVLALYVMDRQVYSAAKLEIIRDNFFEIFHPPDSLNEQARAALFSSSVRIREEERARLQQSLDDIVNGPTSMIRMSLIDGSGQVILTAENLSKTATMNTWQNNLFIREFSGRTSQNVSPPRLDSSLKSLSIGHLVGTYTSPVGVEGITLLTQRYRLYAVAFIAAWFATWLLLYEYLLRPVRNVTLHLDRSRSGVPSLIPSARGALEHGYNELAASAVLQLIEEKLNIAARPDRQASPEVRSRIIQEALDLAGNSFKAAAIRLNLLDEKQQSPSLLLESHTWQKPGIRNISLPDLPAGAAPDEPEVRIYDDNSGFRYYAPLADGFLLVDCIYGAPRSRSAAEHDNLVRVCEVLKGGFLTYQAYHEHLFRERSEANISLSRNMGHDLTNIIATSKLELMGVKRIIEQTGPDTPIVEPKASILKQGVKGLLESTRLLQEMVNIYRSFSYIKRPAYERRALAPLVEEFLAMFEPALSTQVVIERRFENDVPAPIVEARLLKLALFNVLQNAIDALKKMPDLRSGEGRIMVSIKHDSAHDTYEICIEDNGPGIRSHTGELLSPAEAQAVFDYGYSTKSDSGEGLGLNWVRSIMTDFHDGGVRAENRPEGGAAIVLWFQSMERKEARVETKSFRST